MDQRAELLERLRPFASQAELVRISEEPGMLAVIVGTAEARDMMMRTEVAEVVASRFVYSDPVVSYFTDGVGSVSIDEQPPWVSELAHHEAVPIDAGNTNHQSAIDFKITGWK